MGRGLSNIVCLLPILLGTFFFSETALPDTMHVFSTGSSLLAILSTALLSVPTSTIIVAGITLTPPVSIRIGASLLVPVSLLWDVVFDGKEPGLLCWLGTLFTILSFLLLNIDWPSRWN